MGERRPILHSQRLFLRPAEAGDVGLLARWTGDAEVMETLGGRAPRNVAALERSYERLQQEQGETRWHFLICFQADERAIGIVSLDRVDRLGGVAELGMQISEPALWGQGYGTEAARAILDFGFGELRLHRVFLHVLAHNDRAVRAYLRVGFRHEGTAREAFYRHGRYLDLHVMGILRPEWQSMEGPKLG